MLGKIAVVLSVLALAGAQLPNLGWCPEYVPMANFDMSRFLGTWYEAERYFQLSEIVSRCVMANYTKGNDGRFRVSNEVTNRFTGVKRVLDGEIKAAASKADEGKLHVKYTTLPLTPETQYSVLETDYKNYAVLWSCSGFGPVHTQNAWIMTRQPLAPGEILQKAYGVLDKYKISKTFFVKTDQDDCVFLAGLPANPSVEEPQSDQPQEEEPVEQSRNVEKSDLKAEVPVVPKVPGVPAVPVVPIVPAIILKSAAVSDVVPDVAKPDAPAPDVAKPDVPAPDVAKLDVAKPEVAKPEAAKPEKPVQSIKQVPAVPETVPELILKVADQAKEVVEEAIKKIEEAPKEVPKKEEIIVEAEKIVA